MRLSKVASELNITWQRVSEFLEEVGAPIEGAVTPNARINDAQHSLLINEFQSDGSQKQKSDEVLEAKRQKRESMIQSSESEAISESVIVTDSESVVNDSIVVKLVSEFFIQPLNESFVCYFY